MGEAPFEKFDIVEHEAEPGKHYVVNQYSQNGMVYIWRHGWFAAMDFKLVRKAPKPGQTIRLDPEASINESDPKEGVMGSMGFDLKVLSLSYSELDNTVIVSVQTPANRTYNWRIERFLAPLSSPPTVKNRTKTYPTCPRCGREVSPYMDAYYGTDLSLKDLCRDCRGRR